MRQISPRTIFAAGTRIIAALLRCLILCCLGDQRDAVDVRLHVGGNRLARALRGRGDDVGKAWVYVGTGMARS